MRALLAVAVGALLAYSAAQAAMLLEAGRTIPFNICAAVPSPTPTAEAAWDGTAPVSGTAFSTNIDRNGLRRDDAAGQGTTPGQSQNTAGTKQLVRRIYLPPLRGDQTVGVGTVTGYAFVNENRAADNIDRLCSSLKVVQQDGTIRCTILAVGCYGTTNEFPESTDNTTGAVRTIFNGQALTPCAAKHGDHVMVELGYSNSTTGQTPKIGMPAIPGGTGLGLCAADETSTTNCYRWFKFSQDMRFCPDGREGMR